MDREAQGRKIADHLNQGLQGLLGMMENFSADAKKAATEEGVDEKTRKMINDAVGGEKGIANELLRAKKEVDALGQLWNKTVKR